MSNLLCSWQLPELHVILGVAILLLGFAYRDRPIFVSRCNHIKGPSGLPLIGNTLQVLKDAVNPLQAMFARSVQYGLPNTMTVLGMGRAINVTRPDWIQHIQKTNFVNYVKGPKLHACLHDLLGDGIFNADGNTWKAQRKVGSNIMTTSNLKNLVSHVLDAQSERFCALLQQASEKAEPVDLQGAFFDFTIQTFLNIAFSTDLDSVQSADSTAGMEASASDLSFAEAFDLSQQLSVRRINRPWWKLTRRWSSEEKKLKVAIRKIDDCLFPLIERRSSDKPSKTRSDLLDLFLAYRDEQQQPLTHRQLRDALLNYLLAGRDTTAESLSWATFELLRHPLAIRDLREEINDNNIAFDVPQGFYSIHSNDFPAERTSTFEFGHTKQLHQARAIYHESLRLHPSVPHSSKVALDDDILPGGVFIPKDTTVIWSDWLLARSKDVWGEDAQEWKPQRWLDSNGNFVSEGPWKFHAFNGGPRTCLGIQLAQFQGIYMLTRIFSQFDLELESDLGLHHEPEVENTLTLPMRKPLMVRIYPRID